MKIIVLLLVLSCYLSAQESFTIVSVSPFLTAGKYSNKISSESKAAYASVNYDGDFILVSGLDFISLKNQGWDYKQQSISLSGVVKFSDFFLKLSGIKVKGDFIDNLFSQAYNYQDEILSITSEIIYKYNWNYFGLSYNYLNSPKGFDTTKASNLSLRYETFFDYYNFLSVRPNIYLDNSGEELFSLSSKFTHWFSSDFAANINLTIGNRKYYFDNDLLTIYNQYEIQKLVVGFGLDYSIIDEITLSAGFQHSRFENFNVNYLFIGLRTKFIFSQ
jgi:hypothetical protein